MNRRRANNDDHEDLNIWPAFTDLMSNAFMILLLVLLIAIVKSALTQKNLELTLTNLVNNKDKAVEFAKKIPPVNFSVVKQSQTLAPKYAAIDH